MDLDGAPPDPFDRRLIIIDEGATRALYGNSAELRKTNAWAKGNLARAELRRFDADETLRRARLRRFEADERLVEAKKARVDAEYGPAPTMTGGPSSSQITEQPGPSQIRPLSDHVAAHLRGPPDPDQGFYSGFFSKNATDEELDNYRLGWSDAPPPTDLLPGRPPTYYHEHVIGGNSAHSIPEELEYSTHVYYHDGHGWTQVPNSFSPGAAPPNDRFK
jgi:hypothetical protein